MTFFNYSHFREKKQCYRTELTFIAKCIGFNYFSLQVNRFQQVNVAPTYLLANVYRSQDAIKYFFYKILAYQ